MKTSEARVLLTGATGGIGMAVAAELLRHGAALLLAARSPAQLATLARRLGRDAATQARIEWFAADLDDPAAIAGLRDAALAWRANVLVHAAGTPSFGRFAELDAEHLERCLRTNLLAPMRLAQALLPGFGALPKAQLILVGSALGRIGLPGFSVYSAAKFGLRGFAEALRRELRGTPVRVQYLGPRSTRTRFNDERVEAYNRATGTAMDGPAEVARALRALLESEAAERFVGFPERLAVRLNGAMPALLDGAFHKHRLALPGTGPAGETEFRNALRGETP